MYRKFSKIQKSVFVVGIVVIIVATILFAFSVSRGFNYQSSFFLIEIYGLLVSVLLFVGGIILVIKGSLFWQRVHIDEQGFSIFSKSGSIKRTIGWLDIEKLVVCEYDGHCYICISTDVNISPQYTHMYGIIMAPFYCKNCISFPADPILIASIEKQLSNCSIDIEYTGSIQMINWKPTKKVSSPILAIDLVVILMLILLFWYIL